MDQIATEIDVNRKWNWKVVMIAARKKETFVLRYIPWLVDCDTFMDIKYEYEDWENIKYRCRYFITEYFVNRNGCIEFGGNYSCKFLAASFVNYVYISTCVSKYFCDTILMVLLGESDLNIRY